MEFTSVKVVGNTQAEQPGLRVEANKPYALAMTALMLAVLALAIWALISSDELLVLIAFVFLVLGGYRYLILVPARVFGRTWVRADGDGFSASSILGVTRYGWDRVVSVHWQFGGLPFARLTTVQVEPTLGGSEDPYGPINPYEVTLWFLGSRRRALEIGRTFLAVCNSYGAKTSLLLGKIRQ